MIRLAIALVIVVVTVASRIRARGAIRRHALAHGWAYTEQDDQLAATWTLPPFVQLPSPVTTPVPAELRTVKVTDVVRFAVEGSSALSFTLTEVSAEQQKAHHVVALHTRQQLPRTMVRAGNDVYVLPAYEGLLRVREPKIWVKGGMLSVLSEDPRAAERPPVQALSRQFDLDHRLTLVADGDWLYAYRPGTARPWRIDRLLDVLQRFARAVEAPRWPGPDRPSTYVYGAV